MSTTRRLAAILAADVAGYSRLMAADEVGTLEALKACRREVMDPQIAEHHGRIVKTTGDGMLVEFASAVDAVTCAMAVQEAMASRGGNLAFRIGINVGDIISDGDDIFGDGVNVAARVENECAPGGVCVSANALEQVRNKTTFAFDDLGEKTLKNIDRPIRIYAVHKSSASAAPSLTDANKPLPLPDKPSIAVLPFQNMSGDPEQEYFADGIVEDIITALSRFESLFVIARNSSFTYKGKAVDIKQVGRELGVRYVLEGSVRKAGDRVRITGQLIEAATNNHLWADKYDGSFNDIFDLQDKLTSSIVLAALPRLTRSEIDRSLRKPTESLDARDYFWRAREKFTGGRRDRETLEAVAADCRRAIEIDPTFADAYGLAAQTQVGLRVLGGQGAEALADAARFAKSAIEYGRDNAYALGCAAMFYGFSLREVDTAANLVERSIALNANNTSAWLVRGWINVWLGFPQQAIDYCEAAIRLSPLDPSIGSFHETLAWSHFYLKRYDEALSRAKEAIFHQPENVSALRSAVASLAMLNRIDEAHVLIARLRELGAWKRLAEMEANLPNRRKEDTTHFIDAMRMAGAPE